MNGGRNYKQRTVVVTLINSAICWKLCVSGATCCESNGDNAPSADNQQERPSRVSENGFSDELGHYLAGFVDGEGSFNVSIKKVNDRNLGWRVTACFNVSQRESRVLELLQKALGCGTIRARRDGVHYFEVNSFHDLVNTVVPFFRKYSLRSPDKSETLEVFAQICEMMCAGEHLSPEGVREIVRLRNRTNNETSKRHRSDNDILDSLDG